MVTLTCKHLAVHTCFGFRDDPELDRMMKERLRWGDPMAHLVKVMSQCCLVAEISQLFMSLDFR